MEVQRLCPDRPYSSSILRTKLSKFYVPPWLAKVPRFSLRVAPSKGWIMVRRHRPTVIVLDEDSGAGWSGQLTAQYDEQSQRHHTPLLVLGTARRRHRLPTGDFVAKPYHYGPLVRKIELLLAQAQQAFARSA